MPNEPGQEPDNAAAQAMRDLTAMRGTHEQLVRVSKEIEIPPLTPEEIKAQFARETGLIVNDNGEIVGKVPGWRPSSDNPDTGAPPAPARAPRLIDETPRAAVAAVDSALDGSGYSALENGIDLDQGVAVFEGKPYQMEEEEIGVVMLAVSNIMARETNKRIQEKLARFKFPKPPEVSGGGEGSVPPVPPAPDTDRVPPGRATRKARKAKVV